MAQDTVMAPETETVLERFDPKAPQVLADPYAVYRRYRSADPVHWGVSGLAGYPGAWYLFGNADAVSILKDPRFGKERQHVTFSNEQTPAACPRPPVPEQARPFFETARQWLVHRDPPEHSRLRALMSTAFSPRVAPMRQRVEEIAERLIDRVEERGEMDFIADFAYPLPAKVVIEMLGIPDADRHLFETWSLDLQAIDLKTSEETWARAGCAIAQAKDYLRDLVAERRRQPRQDLTSGLIEERDSGGAISEDEMIANLFFFYFAGAGLETTVGFIGSIAYSLLTNPTEKAKLIADPRLASSALEEVLRCESPVQMTNRIAFEDVELDGRQIRRGDSVLIVLGAANRDPAVFPDPDRFDIGRKNRHHAFGIGPHYCLGAPLGRLEGEVALEVLLRRLPNLRLSRERTARWGENAAVRSLKSLPVEF